MIWLIIRKKDRAVVGTAYREPPARVWNPDLFEIKPWPGSEPPIHDPAADPPVKSLDPWLTATLDDVRAMRDWLLAACDWSQIADVPLETVKRDDWRAYRQALRDIPQTFRSPQEVEWPEKPGERLKSEPEPVPPK